MPDVAPEDIPCCPHCDQPIQFADYVVMSAYGAYYLAHTDCGAEAEAIGQDHGPK